MSGLAWRGERGATLVEFALVTPLILLILFGIADFGRAIYYHNTLSRIAREGTRQAIVQNYSGDWSAPGNAPGAYTGTAGVPANTIVGRVVSSAVSFDRSQLRIAVEAPDRLRAMNFPVTVTVEYPFVPVTSMVIGGQTVVLRGQSTMIIE